MLRVDNIKLALNENEQILYQKAAKALRIPSQEIVTCKIVRKSIDGRGELHFVYSVAVTLRREEKCKRGTPYQDDVYIPPTVHKAFALPPVVIGAGPAGLFATLILARCGLRPILLERGQCVEQRAKDVEAFWRSGILNAQSNVQFGEGGAGAFSDGKLNTGTKDERHRFILEQLVACGAPAAILTDAKPHVGTDKLYLTLKEMRRELLSLHTDIRFGHKLVGLLTDNGSVRALRVEANGETYLLPCHHCVLALGHSARDTVEALWRDGVQMVQKPFAMGVRIEHRQSDMDAQQYKEFAGHPALPPSTYKLACHLPNGRSAFSFCVCPGGQVVAAASEEHRVVTNGMSAYARDLENINGALLVNVTPQDFPSTHPLAGIALQRQLEEAAYRLGGGGYVAPCQRVEDFLAHRPSLHCGAVTPSYRPAVRYCDLHDCLPAFLAETLELALPLLDKKLPGYAAPDALLTCVESRSSSPVKIPRDETYQCNIRGVYPCGEGAGYAGGILSAAADGMRCAEYMLKGDCK